MIKQRGWGACWHKLCRHTFFFIFHLIPPGCGALFLRRGTWPACKKQTAFLLRLANFPGGRRSALVKIGALLRVAVAQICSAGRSPLAYLDGIPLAVP